MAPRKQTWAQVKKAGALKSAAYRSAVVNPNSAFAQIEKRNSESFALGLLAKAEREKPDEQSGEASKGKKKSVAKKVTKPKPSPTPKKRGVARARPKKPIEENEEDDRAEAPASWLPYGGNANSKSEFEQLEPTTSIGIARISTRHLESFSLALNELLDPFGSHEVICEETDSGGESVTDVKVEFTSSETAEMIREEIQGDVVAGRKIEVAFV